MSRSWLGSSTIIALILTSCVAAQEIDNSELAFANRPSVDRGMDADRSSTDRAPAKKPSDVVVDVAGIEPKQSISTPDDSNTVVIDPLSAEIDDSPGIAGSWLRGMGFDRWTRQPALAALLSVSLVLLFYAMLRGMGRRSNRRSPVRLPRQVVELVGYAPLQSRQQLQLIRLGSKLVLVAVSATGTEPLAEVTDPVEVDQILAACHAAPSNLVAAISQWGNRNRSGNREYAAGGQRRAARAMFEA